jgi:hypothetical protein
MDAAVILALVTALASLAVALVNTVVTHRLRLAEAATERQAEAEAVLERYRGPLLAAAFDLQDRLDNLINPDRDFLAAYGGRRNPLRDEAIRTTLYRVGQYFCWVEIMRADRQYLQFREPEHTRAVADLVGEVGRTFADDRYGRDFMLWREEQRAIGERMIERHGDDASCVGYATFAESYEQTYSRWLGRFEGKLDRATAMKSTRLPHLRTTLRSLVAALDPEELRYGRDWESNLAGPTDG